mmetsp:Transcript_34380/g.39553  ORF Transcript_34380/g.39553 Transcript_34380/m.39553 type:complete len:160 (-) Transcript_34380:71-550(-)
MLPDGPTPATGGSQEEKSFFLFGSPNMPKDKPVSVPILLVDSNCFRAPRALKRPKVSFNTTPAAVAPTAASGSFLQISDPLSFSPSATPLGLPASDSAMFSSDVYHLYQVTRVQQQTSQRMITHAGKSSKAKRQKESAMPAQTNDQQRMAKVLFLTMET